MATSTVLIWNNKLYGAHHYSGHASLSIDSDWEAGAQASTYVSWWPEGEAGKGDKVVADPNLSVSADLQSEKYAPDHIIKINGMNEGQMRAKWVETWSKRNAHYKMRTKNCSTIVARVLCAGGERGGAYRHNLFWTPLKVKRLALQMGGTAVTWIAFLKELNQSGYLSASDATVLSKLYKRDTRHGSASQPTAYYQGGESIAAKPGIKWQNFAIREGNDDFYFYSEAGSLISARFMRVINDNNDQQLTEFYDRRCPSFD